MKSVTVTKLCPCDLTAALSLVLLFSACLHTHDIAAFQSFLSSVIAFLVYYSLST